LTDEAPYPEPGSDEETETVNIAAAELAADVLNTFGPDNEGAAVATLCLALSLVYGIRPPIRAHYRHPETYASACRRIILDLLTPAASETPPDGPATS
jgi:hypothetical protein